MSSQKQYKYTLPIGYVLHGGENDYVIEEVLGKGGFGVTYKVKALIRYRQITAETHFAVKEYFPDSCWRDEDNATLRVPPTLQNEVANGIKDFINEARRLQQVCGVNPNIVTVDEVFEANGTAYYVLEYLDGGDLRKMVYINGAPLTEQQMLNVMVPIGRAVQCLHDNGILHLDIKPDNIVMGSTTGKPLPKLIDFGISVHFGRNGTPTSKNPSLGVSPGYSPIEQHSSVKKFDPRIDVYAFGATCFFLLTGHDPMDAFDLTPTALISAMPATVSPHIARAIAHAMSRDKHHRTVSINELLSELQGGQTAAAQQDLAAGLRAQDATSATGRQLPSKSKKGKQKSSLSKLLIGIAIFLAIALTAGIVMMTMQNSSVKKKTKTERLDDEEDESKDASEDEQSSSNQEASLNEISDNKIHFSFQEIPFSLKIDEFCKRLNYIGYSLIEDNKYSHYRRFKDDEGYSEIWVHWIEQTGQVYMVEDVRLKVIVTEDYTLENCMGDLMDEFGREPVPINQYQEGFVFDYGYIAFDVDDKNHLVEQYVDNENYRVYRNLK